MRILVTGASGLLGLNLCLTSAGEHELTGLVNQRSLQDAPFDTLQADLLQEGAAEELFDQVRPQAVIHCAAMADVDRCERDPQTAQAINAQVPAKLAALCAQRGARMVHISTDAVFDGQRGSYTEEDQPNPLSVYARTKLEGEQGVLAADPGALVLRVNFYGYSLSGRRSLAEFFLNNLSAGQPLKGFTDVHFCPLYVADLVDVIFSALALDLSGLYHAVSPECLSKYDFGRRIADKFGLPGDLIQPVSVNDGNLLAKRSPNLTLRVDKLQAAGVELPGQAEGLERFHQHFCHGYPELVKSYAS
ncbi:MAG: dTDP-4-dehydrorhamnose reductase [Chloroflexota bacterium]|nr:dTDP-4-dehydrorhamnose reductase [Chloroflexota bacterium]